MARARKNPDDQAAVKIKDLPDRRIVIAHNQSVNGLTLGGWSAVVYDGEGVTPLAVMPIGNIATVDCSKQCRDVLLSLRQQLIERS